ncbi:hypothetical protein MMB17_22565 [Methylobacterium organophilum]|uniref:hypothetical protein n=1 Tax=Methylobacterium organophilum TaxID=410 RepID=UPI001F12D7ED|nr:hypothetical protein [Methylobacterium organophilum]UMY17372.1 hypothetical protein MMB17_22565 [Methylobacterium organophilum]
MSHGTGSVTALLVLLLGTLAASAQESGREARPGQGSWTDPPARTAAPDKSAESAKAAERAAPVAGARAPSSQERQRPEKVARQSPTPAASGLARPPRRATAQRTRTVKAAPAKARPTRVATRSRPPRREAGPVLVRDRAPARAVDGFAYGPAYPTPRDYPVMVGRRLEREGWEDERAHRIARARAAGFLVMRARTVRYPDGTVVRSLRPVSVEDDF